MTIMKTIVVLMLSTAPALAQHSHGDHGGAEILETGQAQFASIAEIVALLRDNPATDWDRVDIQALRDHLVDMDNVTTRSMVTGERKGTRVTFAIKGDADVTASIQRMVAAHGPMLEAETGWTVTSATVPNGATMSIMVPNVAERNQLLGIGFYGLMTIGAHHQEHHLMIATGQSPH